VIGNPPYGAEFTKSEAAYFNQRYRVSSGARDVYVFFIERVLGLLAEKGRFSFIVPSAWLGGPEYRALRELLLAYRIDRILLLPFDVFKDAYIDTGVLVLSNEKPNEHKVRTFVFGKKEKLSAIDLSDDEYSLVNPALWGGHEDKKFVLDPHALLIVERIRKSAKSNFSHVIALKRGVLFDKDLLTKKRSSRASHRYFEGDVYRYQLNLVAPNWVEFDERMTERPKEFKWFDGPRLLLRRLVNRRQRLMATFAAKTFVTNKNLYSVLPNNDGISLLFVLGILNSRLVSYLYINQVTQATKDDFPQVTIEDILKLPFPYSVDNSRHHRMVGMVEQMLTLHKQLASAKTEHEKTALHRQIDATDEQIDQLVYELYGLTEEEIKIVEGAE
jgi:adenine-specific DNA-methyltransferase